MIRTLLLGSLCALSLATPALADSANLLGVFGNWTAYSTGTGSSHDLLCHVQAARHAAQERQARPPSI